MRPRRWPPSVPGADAALGSPSGPMSVQVRGGPVISSSRVVEDDSERGPLPTGDRAHAVAQPDAVVAAFARVRTVARREDGERAARRPDHVRATLRAWA